MERNIEERKQYDEPFKQAAAHFYHHSGRSLEEVSTELGLSPAELRTWKRKYPSDAPQKTAEPLNPSANSGRRTGRCATKSCN